MVLPDGALGPRQPSEVETVQLDLLARPAGVHMALRQRQVGFALVGVAVAGNQRQALGTGVFSPTRHATRQTPCRLILMAPQFSHASSAEIRRGP